MNAQHTLLTHFSQRYAKVPLLDNLPASVGIAFDNMKVSVPLWLTVSVVVFHIFSTRCINIAQTKYIIIYMSPGWTILLMAILGVLITPLTFSTSISANFQSVEHHLSSSKPHILFFNVLIYLADIPLKVG